MPKIELVQEPATISSNEVLELTVKTLKTYFNLSVNGHKYPDDTIFHILVKASADKSTIEDTCAQLDEAPHSNAVRYQLNKGLLLDIKVLEDQVNEALLKDLPPGIKGRKHDVAIDLAFIPYHGQAHRSEDEIRRSKA